MRSPTIHPSGTLVTYVTTTREATSINFRKQPTLGVPKENGLNTVGFSFKF
uniref:hypothetical protein n=1 Tax=Prevotella sp. TaxID=59823 RepID=UPI004024EEC5